MQVKNDEKDVWAIYGIKKGGISEGIIRRKTSHKNALDRQKLNGTKMIDNACDTM